MLSMLEKTKINNFVVRPLNIVKDDRPVKGGFMMKKCYCTTYILGKKESGKTHLLFNIIINRIQENTTIVIFSSTLYADDSWVEIRKFLDRKQIPTQYYESIYDDKGHNLLAELVHQLEDEAKEREKERKKMEAKKRRRFDVVMHYDEESTDEEEEEAPKPKYLAPDWLILIDDLSDEIKDKSLDSLIKKHRHFHSQIIVCNQALNDLSTAGRKNLDYWILFKDLDDKKLMQIFERVNLGKISFEMFKEMYLDATKEPYHFFYFSSTGRDFRCNFNEQYNIDHFTDEIPEPRNNLPKSNKKQKYNDFEYNERNHKIKNMR